MQNKELQKPTFIKIAEIVPGRHCYHVYGKILEVKTSNITRLSGDVIKIAEGKIADDSGCANFRFEGKNVDLLKQGGVVAVRNGRSEVVDEHIRLEVDKFGKISTEDASNVKSTNTERNISAVPYEKKPRRGGRD